MTPKTEFDSDTSSSAASPPPLLLALSQSLAPRSRNFQITQFNSALILTVYMSLQIDRGSIREFERERPAC